MYIYIEVLSIYTFILYICPCILKYRNYNTVHIYYFNKLWTFRILLPILNKFNYININKFTHEFRNILDENGECINSKFTRKIMFQVKNDLIQSNEIKYIFQQIDNNNLIQYLVKSIISGNTKTDINSIPYCIYLILRIKYHMEELECKSSYLIIKNRPWLYYYSSYAKKYSISIKSTPSFRINIQEVLYNLYYKSIYFINYISKLLIFNRILSTDVNNKFKILSDTVGEFNLTKDGYNSDLFYYLYSDLEGDRLCFRYTSEYEKKQLLENKITPLNVNIIFKLFYFTFIPKNYYIPRIIFKSNLESKSISKAINQYVKGNYYWDNIFKKYFIKIYLTWYKYDESHIAICNSIRNNNGVMCLWERSFDGQPSPFKTIVADIMFRNTSLSISNDITNESEIKYTVITGFMRDYGLEIIKQKASKIREYLKSNGAKYIISVFDQNSNDSYENGKHNDNYEEILKFIISNKEYAVIFKPKKAHTYKYRLKVRTLKLLLTAQKTGRCYVYSSTGKYQSNVPSILAALSSDICIHSHLYAGTAALECAFIGKPTIMIDREGHPYDVLYNSGINESIFRNWGDVIYVLNEYFTSKYTNNNLGNLSPLISAVEPFRDGKGAFRMGSYIQNLLRELELCKDRETALSNAAEIYAKKWGENNVVLG